MSEVQTTNYVIKWNITQRLCPTLTNTPSWSRRYTQLSGGFSSFFLILFSFFSPLVTFQFFFNLLFHSYLRFKPNFHANICQSVFLMASVFFYSLTFLWIESKSETIAHPGLVRRGTAAINLPGDARKDNVAQDSKFSRVEKYICVNRGAFCSRWTIYLNMSENHN